MATPTRIREGARAVKPILSLDRTEARRRVHNLYKLCYRHIPYISEHSCFGLLYIYFNLGPMSFAWGRHCCLNVFKIVAVLLRKGYCWSMQLFGDIVVMILGAVVEAHVTAA